MVVEGKCFLNSFKQLAGIGYAELVHFRARSHALGNSRLSQSVVDI